MTSISFFSRAQLTVLACALFSHTACNKKETETETTPPASAPASQAAATGPSASIAVPAKAIDHALAAPTTTEPGVKKLAAALMKDIAAVQPAGSTAPAAETRDAPAPTTSLQGPSASGDGFTTWLQSSSPLVAGKPANIEVILTAQAPFKCNDKYPYKFALDASAGAPATVIRGMQVNKMRGSLKIPFTPGKAGTSTIKGTLSFSVCTDDKCLVERQALTLTLPVSEG